MSEYAFADGPLAGQAISAAEGHARGDLLTFQVVDVMPDTERVPLHLYRVETTVPSAATVVLRHVPGVG